MLSLCRNDNVFCPVGGDSDQQHKLSKVLLHSDKFVNSVHVYYIRVLWKGHKTKECLYLITVKQTQDLFDVYMHFSHNT